MNYSTSVILINDAIRAVKGQYKENDNHEVFKTIDQDLKVGDFATVESSTRWGFTTVKIVAVDVDVDFDSSKHVYWVVQKLGIKQHEEIKAMEVAAIELIKNGELRKRRNDIKRNTLDAVSAEEIDKLDIARLGHTAIEAPKSDAV